MKAGLTSADLRVLVAEWQALVGGYVDKVYQADRDVIVRFHVPGSGKSELFFSPGKWLCLHELEEKPEAPLPFAQTLRRLLDNARVTRIEQRGFDRIAVFTLDRGPETHRVVFEVFGNGNVAVVKGDTTVACLTPIAYRDRSLQPGEPYAFPPAGIDPLSLDRRGFADAVRSGKGQAVRVLASVLNLGGQYAEEVCLRAQVSKAARAKDLTDGDLDALYTSLNNVVVALDSARRPALVLEGGRAVDAVPIELVQYADAERTEFPTFNEALSAYLKAAPPEEEATDEVGGKYARRIAQQEESLRALREQASDLEAQALFLYGHFQPFDELLRALREGREPPEHAQIKAVDRKARTVTLSLGDIEAITLAYDEDVTANAQAFYDRRREAQQKAERVADALEATRAEMAQAQRKADRAAKRPRVRKTKGMWFDAYRWVLSSEGHLVLGGRDARSNDQVVKKHLKEGDRYAHADVHGAPSVVVKEGSRAGEATLREACEFALAYSKAWSAGLASGSAYWVLPEQVSKQAESGEFLPRGAFVIRGKRNYLHGLPVRLAVGEVEVEGHRKIMGGPVSAVAARSTRYAILGPGRGGRDPLARRLAALFAVTIEEVARVLPPGGSDVVGGSGIDLGGAAAASSS